MVNFKYGQLTSSVSDKKWFIMTLQRSHSVVLYYWHFLRCIRSLNPLLSTTVEFCQRFYASQGQFSEAESQWVRRSLQEHNLSSQLCVLVSNRMHLLQHYYGLCAVMLFDIWINDVDYLHSYWEKKSYYRYWEFWLIIFNAQICEDASELIRVNRETLFVTPICNHSLLH